MDKADASDACVALIDESSRRWREAEGNYRDDITAIVCHLPMGGAPDQMSASAVASKGQGQTHTPTNSFKVAPSSRKNSFEDLSASTSPPKEPEPQPVAGGAESRDSTGFAKRRLSVQGQVEEEDVTEEKLASLRAEFGGKAP